MPSDMGEESEAAKTGGVLEKHEFCDFVGTGTKMKGASIHGARFAPAKELARALHSRGVYQTLRFCLSAPTRMQVRNGWLRQ